MSPQEPRTGKGGADQGESLLPLQRVGQPHRPGVVSHSSGGTQEGRGRPEQW